MADKMDALLFDIGEERNSQVDFDAMYDRLLAEERAHVAARRLAVRYAGAAAAFVVLLGVGGLMLSSKIRMGAPKAQAPMAAAAGECAPMAEEAECEAAEECAPMELPALPEECAADDIIDMPACDKSQYSGSVAADGGKAQKAAQAVEIGIAAENFRELLEERGFAITDIHGEAPDISEGWAAMQEGSALWNTGRGVYEIRGDGVTQETLRAVCQQP